MKLVAVDCETTGLVFAGTKDDWGFYPARPFAFSFCDDSGNTNFLRWQVDPYTRQVLVPSKKHGDWSVLRDVLSDDQITKVFFNMNYDQRMLELTGVKLAGPMEDALPLVHQALGGDSPSFALKFISDRYLGFPKDDEAALKVAVNAARRKAKSLGYCIAEGPLFGKKDKWKADMWLTIDQVPKLCKIYAIKDAERTMLAWMTYYDDVMGTEGKRLTYEREQRLQPYIRKLEDRGLRVYPKTVDRLVRFYERKANEYYGLVKHEVGYDINLGSTKQLGKYFFQEQGLTPTKLTKKGNPSLAHLALADIVARGHPVAAEIMNYRTCKSAVSLFLQPYRNYMYRTKKNEWIIHTNIRQMGTSTGRMAAADPNLMNVASESTGFSLAKQRMKPRKCFGPREGHIWVLPDFNQIEVWCFAFAADDPTMKKALLGGYDFHGYISEKVYGERHDFKKRKLFYRKRSKIIQFCKLFGGGLKKIAALLEEPVEIAAGFVKDYESRLPGVMRFMRRVEQRARRDGYVQTLLGRYCNVEPHLAYRGVNYIVQGSAADVFKEGFAECGEMLDSVYPGSYILVPIHDELIIEVPLEHYSNELMIDIRKSLQVASPKIGSPVPLPISFKVVRDRWNITEDVEL